MVPGNFGPATSSTFVDLNGLDRPGWSSTSCSWQYNLKTAYQHEQDRKAALAAAEVTLADIKRQKRIRKKRDAARMKRKRKSKS